MTLSNNNDQILFATAGYDHTIKLWNIQTGQHVRVLAHNDGVSNFNDDLKYKSFN